jgi:hypothetical protein
MRLSNETKRRNIFVIFLGFVVPSNQVAGKPAARGGTGVRKQGSGFSAPGINDEVTYENARIDKARDKVFPEP